MIWRYITPGPVQRSRVQGGDRWSSLTPVHPRRVRRISVKQDLDDHRPHFITDWFRDKVLTIIDETGSASGHLWASATIGVGHLAGLDVDLYR